LPRTAAERGEPGNIRASTEPRAVHSTAAGADRWERLTGAGGEGMVVKPSANLTPGQEELTQPGIKVRGREYLRIICGPDYTESADLDRLRQRGLSAMRSLARREYALGLEALDRVARGDPLAIHKVVFAILACWRSRYPGRRAVAGPAARTRHTGHPPAPARNFEVARGVARVRSTFAAPVVANF
jgi:hypothetical protein